MPGTDKRFLEYVLPAIRYIRYICVGSVLMSPLSGWMSAGRQSPAVRLHRRVHNLSANTVFASWRTSALLRVEIHVTPCIVTSPPHGHCDALINPANERLQGTQFTPGQCARYLAPGTLLLYPPQVIDGLVHGARGDSCGDASGAAALAKAIATLPEVEAGGVRCPTGRAVALESTGELRECYQHVIHTVAPFYDTDRWRELLLSAYKAAFDTSDGIAGVVSVAVPLLGAGARGAPIAAAAEVAAVATAKWHACGSLRLVNFAVQEEEAAWALAEAFDEGKEVVRTHAG